MAVLILPPELRDMLRGIVEPTEFVDDAGSLLGYFNPFVSEDEAALYEKARGLFDLAEAERRLREDKTVPFENVKERLESLGVQR